MGRAWPNTVLSVSSRVTEAVYLPSQVFFFILSSFLLFHIFFNLTSSLYEMSLGKNQFALRQYAAQWAKNRCVHLLSLYPSVEGKAFWKITGDHCYTQ